MKIAKSMCKHVKHANFRENPKKIMSYIQSQLKNHGGRIGIDIVGLLLITERGNKYIVMYIDYLTKWAKAKPLPDKSAVQIAWFIYEEIICRYGFIGGLSRD